MEQERALGTGHAVDQCRTVLADFDGPVLVTYGDTPLFRGRPFKITELSHKGAGCCYSCNSLFPRSSGYGRIVRGKNKDVVRIVEHKDASKEELKIQEINTGTYCFNTNSYLNISSRLHLTMLNLNTIYLMLFLF